MIETGLFIFMNVVAALGFVVTVKYKFGIILLLSFVIFAGLGIWMFGGMGTDLQVAQTHNYYNATGGLVGSETNVFIDGNDGDWNTLGMVYMLAAGVAMTWFVRIIVNMVQARRIKASAYWE